MTIEHHDRFGRDFITNRATRASTGKFRSHHLLSTIHSQPSTRFLFCDADVLWLRKES
jgi:hypothetical protein